MNKIDQLVINNISIDVFGTIEDPLFDAKYIIETILEYQELNECRFYRDNKTNKQFIIIQQQPTGNLTGGVWGNNQHLNINIYLTEFGLYECLFASKKTFAAKFRLDIMTLLKDIRMGNIKLLIENQCETTKQLQETQNSLMQYITKTSDLEKQIIYLEQRLEQSQEEVSVYEIEIDGKKYIGTAIELIRRLKQHLNKSCNPGVRQLIEQKKKTRSYSIGDEVKLKLVHKQKVSNRDERNYMESAFIKRIPSLQRLNKNIPKVRDSSRVSEECKQLVQQALNEETIEEVKIQLNNCLDSITEKSIDMQNVQISEKWNQQYQKYYKFVEVLDRNPKECRNREETLLAKWVYKQRNQYDNLTLEKQEKLSKIKHFKPEVKVINTDGFEAKLQRVKDIYEKSGQTTSAVLGSLFHWYCDYSAKIKQNTIGEYEKKLFEKSGVPLYTTLQEQWMIYYNQCLQIYKDTGKPPIDRPVPNQFNLGRWCRRQIQENYEKLTEEQIKLLADIGISGKKITTPAEYLDLLKQYIQTNKTLPQSTGSKQEVYLYKWMLRNKHKQEVQDLMK